MKNTNTADLILDNDVARDANGNAKTPGRSPEATVKHIGLMAKHLMAEWNIPTEQAVIAAYALHNLHDFRLNTLQRGRGSWIVANAVENAK